MRNFHKISLRPPWSIFIITHKPKIVFTSNQSHWQLTELSKTFLFTPKANSKQKRVKKTQEHEKGTLLLHASPRGRAYSQWRARGEQTLLPATHSFAVASGW